MGLLSHSRPGSPTSRTLAAAIALTVTAAGGGVPMCASLLARAVTPCPMHTDHPVVSTAGTPLTTMLVAAHDSAGACHPDDAGLACATGGVCPAAGAATLSHPGAALTAQPPARHAIRTRELAHPSYLAPPLPPPPQA